MVDFSDVVAFAEAHRACGQITPAVNSEPSGAYMLTLLCRCGAAHERRVSAEEAAHAPVARVTAPAERPDPPRLTPSPELETVLRAAIEAEEAAAMPTASAPPRRPAPRRLAPAPPPPIADVERTVRAAVREHDRLRGSLEPHAPITNAAGPSPKPYRIWFAIAAVVLLAAVGAAVYIIDAPDTSMPAPSGVLRTVR